jgi:tyrosyl-tRNA synthetase
MFGKLMSISDELMWRYFELLSFKSLGDIEKLRADVVSGANPRDVKFELAREIVDRFHSPGEGKRAEQRFIDRFSQGVVPDDLEQKTLGSDGGGLGLARAIKDAGLASSTSEAIRLVNQGAVRLDGERLEDAKAVLRAGTEGVLQVGKRRIARIRID